MKYNFDEVIDRNGNRSAKYDEREKKFGVRDVIPLWIADMDFKTAQPVIDALKARADEGIWGYTSRPDSYYEALCGWQKRRHGWEIDKRMISFSLGVVPSLSSMVHVFTEPGDKVLIQTPVYSEFYDVTESWGRQVLECPMVEKEGQWVIDFEDFEKKAREAKLFFLCSPHNPLGIVWEREQLVRMCEICMKNGVQIVSDEIHSDLVFHEKTHIPAATLSPEIASHVITCISGTKTFNMAGLQASAVVFPNPKLKDAYDKFWFNLDIHRNNAFSSIAMETAFNEGEEWLEQLLEYISGNFDFIRDYCREYIPQIKPNVPDATYLVWLDCRELGMGNEELRAFMIEKAGLGLNEGWSFGRSLSGFMRLNAACPRSVLRQALEQLKEAVEASAASC
ncbi:MAG: putative C-S lyase [Lachnospiraceae bacterium]|nr:putative C-S lyase [Lachnospiraceae bacterium]